VNDIIAGLIRLQEMDKKLFELRESSAQVDPRRSDILSQRKKLVTDLDASKKAFTDAQVLRKNLEMDVEAKDQLVRKHSSELNSVKSNDAYKALISEIDAAKTAKAALEDRVLDVMVGLDDLQKKVKSDEARGIQRRAELDVLESSLQTEAAELQRQVESQQAERDAFFSQLSPGTRSCYETTQRGRLGVSVVVPVVGMTCGGCRTGLTANVLNQVMKDKEIITCESCSRILYLVPKPPEPTVPSDPQPESPSGT